MIITCDLIFHFHGQIGIFQVWLDRINLFSCNELKYASKVILF